MTTTGNRENIVKFYVERSLTTFTDAKILANNNRWDSCLNRLYYACFYMVYALLVQKIDVRAKTHSGIKTLFNEQILMQGLVEKKSGTFYASLMKRRNENDYGDFEISTAEDVLPLISQAEAFINTIQKLIL